MHRLNGSWKQRNWLKMAFVIIIPFIIPVPLALTFVIIIPFIIPFARTTSPMSALFIATMLVRASTTTMHSSVPPRQEKKKKNRALTIEKKGKIETVFG